jgi:uncharacterized protein (TIGR02466 family)
MELIETFKDFVFKTKLNENLKNLIKFSKKIKKQKGRTISNIGGFQSNDLDLNNPVLQSLTNEIIKIANIVSKEVLNLNRQLSLKNMWLNINYYKDYNELHDHPFSILSGVFYIKTSNNCGNIKFFRDTNIATYVPINLISNYNNYNSTTMKFVPKENILYLFPSWTKHLVEPNLSKEERISISFNLL